MLRALFIITAVASLTGCGRLDGLTWDMTPEKWLATHSHIQLKIGSLNFILAEPSSTFFVYALGIILAAVGIYFLRTKGESRSRYFWGVALIVWSLSTFSAGTSYQAFSYEIKCAGRTMCLWTSWWEIVYLMLFVAAMNLITTAVSFSSAEGRTRLMLQRYAAASTGAYWIVVLSGALLPNYFLSSFECMVIFTFPSFIILFSINMANHIKKRQKMDVMLIGAWVFMLFIVMIYFGYFMSGLAGVLWQKGIWFNANDVLHILLICWAGYLYFAVAKHIKDDVRD